MLRFPTTVRRSAAYADAREDFLDEVRGLQKTIHGECCTADGVMAEPCGPVVAQLEAPPAHHVAVSFHKRQSDRARTCNDDAAVVAAEGTQAA